MIGYSLLAVEDEGKQLALTARLDAFRMELASSGGADDLSSLAASCFDLCENAIQLLQEQHAERRSELRRLVTLVRDTLAMLTGDGDAFTSQIAQVAGRFDSLLQVDDVRQLKQRLMTEVGDLRRVAAERQRQWQQSIGVFEARVTALEQQLVEATQEAQLDSLTGIVNRRGFEKAVREALHTPPRAFVIALIDLDDFKAVNDTGGHEAGDLALKSVARAITDAVRKHDVVARIGGDEFAVLATGTTLHDAEGRLRSIVAGLGRLTTGLEQSASLSASCGLAECTAGETLESLMRRADQALYEAKRQGRGRLVVKSPPFIRDLLKEVRR